MAKSKEEKIKQRIEKAKQARKRTIEKQLAKQRDPVELEKRLLKQRESQKRKRERAIELLCKKNSSMKNDSHGLIARNRSSRTRSRGLKGRTPTALEREIMNAIGSLPCICCLMQGRYTPVVSLHHINGRSKEHAHCKVLPLCAWHHDTPIDNESLMIWPDLIPFHAKGLLGGKMAWRKYHGHEDNLLSICYALANIDSPFELNPITNDIDIDYLRSLFPN
ncbi:TPA: Ref family recombination enhancement nuclease [Photobacterium damselae]